MCVELLWGRDIDYVLCVYLVGVEVGLERLGPLCPVRCFSVPL